MCQGVCQQHPACGVTFGAVCSQHQAAAILHLYRQHVPIQLSLRKGAQQGSELPAPTTTRSGIPCASGAMPQHPHAARDPVSLAHRSACSALVPKHSPATMHLGHE